MKINLFRLMATALAILMSRAVLAGGVAGGGGPPSLEQKLAMRAGEGRTAFLLKHDPDRFNLGVNAELDTMLKLSPARLTTDSFYIARDEFAQLGRAQTVDAINPQGSRRSYRIENGAEPETLLLLDRRALARASLSL